jgi:hypothetical protein
MKAAMQIRLPVLAGLAAAALCLPVTAAPGRQRACAGFRASKACATGQVPPDPLMFQCSRAAPSRYAGECICKAGQGGRPAAVHLACGHVNVTCARICHFAVPACEINQFGEIRCLTLPMSASGAHQHATTRPVPPDQSLGAASTSRSTPAHSTSAKGVHTVSPGAATSADAVAAAQEASSALKSRIRMPAPVRRATALTRAPEAHGRRPCTPSDWAGSAPGLRECDFGIWVNRLHGPDAVVLARTARQRDRDLIWTHSVSNIDL